MNKLEYRNNWESDEYYVGGKRISNLTTVSINGVFYPVTNRVVTIPYDDHGHVYNGISTHYFIVSQDLGVEVDLNRVVRKQKVIAVKFEVQA